MKFSGKIVRDGQAVVDGLSGEIFEKGFWKGNFTITPGTLIDKLPYDLVLDDGRRGQIAVQAIYVTRDQVMVFFDGVGQLIHANRRGPRVNELVQSWAN